MMSTLLLCSLALLAGAVLGSDKLQVHLIMHSHDDPGWLKTADQYYTGANSSVYLASVQYIFDSVVTELQKDSERHFTFCEISFLSRWYYEQDVKMKEQFKRLVNDGQITIVNGGWVMHDEAAGHYMSMIDQTTLGHKFLKEELNYFPRVGWQIDPFGHSNTHAWLSSAVGFDALYFGRIDYQDRAKRMAEKNMEMVWKGSASDADQSVFTGAFKSGNYGPPAGYCFDTSCHYCRDDPVVDAPYLEDRNVDDMVEGYINAILTEHSTSRGNNIMLEVGADFTGDNSHSWFKNMDKLIAAVNKDERFHVFYSDPHTYTKARAAEIDVKWTVKTDDFFPYSDHEHAFWAGYFTSRPTLKYQERTASALLQTLKQMSALPASRAFRAEAERVTFQLTAAVGLVNHHDAVTGTSKQHVADDYMKILAKAVNAAEAFLAKLVGHASPVLDDKASVDPVFSFCRLVNETICAATQSLQTGDAARVSVYNPLPRARTQQVTVPMDVSAGVTVMSLSSSADGASASVVPSDLLPNGNKLAESSAAFVLTFTASEVPALSTATFLIRVSDHVSSAAVAVPRTPVALDAASLPVSIASDKVSVTFHPATGLLESITRLDVVGADGAPLTAQVSQDFGYYKSFGSPGIEGTVSMKDDRDPHLKNIQPLRDADSVQNQPGGAYLMRTSTPYEVPTRIAATGAPVTLTVARGKSVKEVHQQFNTYASQIVRLRDGSPAVELEWTVGPVPINDNIGKEVISKFTSNLHTGGAGNNVFYTDSNGREFMKRRFNYRPTWDLEVFEPIAGNYYPLSAAMFVRDEAAQKQLAVLTDRSVGGASLLDGEMELLIHRRLVVDDNRGVEEPLNETTGGMSHYPDWIRYGDGITVTGKHYVLLSSLDVGMKEVRSLMDELYLPLVPLFAPLPAAAADAYAALSAKTAAATSVLSADLPRNVHLATLQAVTDRELLVRLAHQFAVGEDPELSRPVTIDLFALLAAFQPTAADELTLSANQLKSEQLAGKIQWPTEDSASASVAAAKAKTAESPAKASLRKAASVATSYPVELQPMQIKTFRVQISAAK